ncbi:unnamed protein product [Phyllotreta striolata]|uniref:DNA replication complex GINS protein SLD5 n=1 Tax=Phyllotreta striolata TaxID=444603 RepID=A0A9N9TRT9_PHYSR|nr:unnamed protein product [Phyllotreta striolata]
MDLDDTNLEDLNDSNDSEDYVHITPAEVLELMEETWVNEKFAPEILPNKTEVVDIILEQIKSMEVNIKNLSNDDFTKNIYQLEVDKLRFMVTSYLRTRLEKIESYVVHILKEEEKRVEKGESKYLSEQEYKFAQDYSRSMDRYFNKIMNFCPNLTSDTWSSKVIEPNNNSFVFMKSKKTIEGLPIDITNADSDLVDIKSGSRVIICYSSIEELVKNGDVNLI